MSDFDEDFELETAPAEADRLTLDLDGWEGPLDLLLTLARTQKVDLAKISILALVEQYLAFITDAKKLKLEIAADYLVMAAWLASLKSALLLPRNRPGRRTPLWSQRLRAQTLLAAALQHSAFPIVLETYRECLHDVFDVPALTELLTQIRRRELRVVEVETTRASPLCGAPRAGRPARFRDRAGRHPRPRSTRCGARYRAATPG